MRLFKNKGFARFARKESVRNSDLCKAAADVAADHYDADLGGGVFKQRVARPGGGKSGGFRTIILFRKGRHTFFVHGFAKNAKANVTEKELEALKLLADRLLVFGEKEIKVAVEAGELIEVFCDDEDEKGTPDE